MTKIKPYKQPNPPHLKSVALLCSQEHFVKPTVSRVRLPIKIAVQCLPAVSKLNREIRAANYESQEELAIYKKLYSRRNRYRSTSMNDLLVDILIYKAKKTLLTLVKKRKLTLIHYGN